MGGVVGYLMTVERHSNAGITSDDIELDREKSDSSVDFVKWSCVRKTTVPHLVDHLCRLHVVFTKRSASH